MYACLNARPPYVKYVGDDVEWEEAFHHCVVMRWCLNLLGSRHSETHEAHSGQEEERHTSAAPHSL